MKHQLRVSVDLGTWKSRLAEPAARGTAQPAPARPGADPNEAYAVQVARAGYLPVPLAGEDYIELLPACWRAINDYGIAIGHRTYDCPGLGPYRRKASPVPAMRGRWEVHYDPYDLSRIWVRDQAGGWITVPWTQLPMVAVPFADFTWRYARQILAALGGDDTDQTAVARVLAALLHRAKDGPPDRVIARTSAAAASSSFPECRAPARTARQMLLRTMTWLATPASSRSECSTRWPRKRACGDRRRRSLPADHPRRLAAVRGHRTR